MNNFLIYFAIIALAVGFFLSRAGWGRMLLLVPVGALVPAFFGTASGCGSDTKPCTPNVSRAKPTASATTSLTAPGPPLRWQGWALAGCTVRKWRACHCWAPWWPCVYLWQQR